MLLGLIVFALTRKKNLGLAGSNVPNPLSKKSAIGTGIPCIAGNTIMINDNPAKIIPIENLTGVDGWRLPSFIQSHANIGAKMTTNNGFNDWNQDD